MGFFFDFFRIIGFLSILPVIVMSIIWHFAIKNRNEEKKLRLFLISFSLGLINLFLNIIYFILSDFVPSINDAFFLLVYIFIFIFSHIFINIKIIKLYNYLFKKKNELGIISKILLAIMILLTHIFYYLIIIAGI